MLTREKEREREREKRTWRQIARKTQNAEYIDRVQLKPLKFQANYFHFNRISPQLCG